MLDPLVIDSLVRIIELKDLSTAAHTWRVVLYTRVMAEAFALKPDHVDRLAVAAALHDLGKIDVPTPILQKPGPLTAEEFAIVQRHTLTGHERLRAMGVEDHLVLELVRHHHERVDGKGYPDGLRGDAIPLPARFFAVIDTFDALTSYRPYRQDVGPQAAQRALVELQAGAGTRYFLPAVELLTDLYHEGQLSWIMQHYNDGVAPPEYRQE
jgi:HD-GYP domain-containing protein (c-di-GMP phosphodiesterase class II)